MGAASHKRLGVVSGLLSITRTLGQTTGIATLGAFWAARVAFYSNHDTSLAHADTVITAQVAGLQDTITGTILIVGFALMLSIWAAMLSLLRHRTRNKKNLVHNLTLKNEVIKP